MSFIAGYLLGLSESGGGQTSAGSILEQLDREPALASVDITDGWNVKIKCTKSTDFSFGFASYPQMSSEGVIYPYSESRYYLWFICVYLNGEIRFAFCQPYNVPYIYDSTENEDHEYNFYNDAGELVRTYKRVTITKQYCISNLNVYNAGFAGVDSGFMPKVGFNAVWDKTTRYLSTIDESGTPKYNEYVQRSGWGNVTNIFPDNGAHTPLFWGSGCGGEFERRDILFEYLNACCRRFEEMKKEAEEKEKEKEAGGG